MVLGPLVLVGAGVVLFRRRCSP
ncbi:hypothetical protein [Tsukamurella ocularis]